MIKAVLFSLSTYFMSVFSIPCGIVKKIEKIFRGFFWYDGIVKRKIDWVSLYASKCYGGLGIGRVADKGTSLLAKWIWRFGKEELSLWKKVTCVKYDLDQKTLFFGIGSVLNPVRFSFSLWASFLWMALGLVRFSRMVFDCLWGMVRE